MYREIGLIEGLELFLAGEDVLLLDPAEGMVVKVDDVLEQFRVIADFADEDPEEAPEEEPEEEPEDEPAEAPEQETKPRRPRRTRAEIEAAVIKAWNRGERTIPEIMGLTGCTYRTVRKYIPETSEG